MELDVAAVLRGEREGRFTRDEALRAVVAHEPWWIPLDEEGEPFVVAGDRAGVELLIAESARPGGRARASSGRALLDEVADGFDGVVFDPDEPWAAGFRASALDTLRAWAVAVTLEEALRRPAPGQLEALIRGPWWILARDPGGPPAVVRGGWLPVCTGPDRAALVARIEPGPLHARSMPGDELWPALAARDDYDGIAFELHRSPVSFGPHLCYAWAEGREVRPGAVALPARTEGEIHRWLDLEDVPERERPHTVESWHGQPVAMYHLTRDYRAWDVPFVVVPPAADPQDLGAGRTQILCAGRLAMWARTQLAGLPADPRALDASQVARAEDARRCLEQLLALCEADRIPCRELRSPEGARDTRERPQLRQRAWIEEQLALARRLTRGAEAAGGG